MLEILLLVGFVARHRDIALARVMLFGLLVEFSELARMAGSWNTHEP